MFFSPDLLTFRGGKFALIWSLSCLSKCDDPSSLKKVSKADVQRVDVGKTCQDLVPFFQVRSQEGFSLYLSAKLIHGAARCHLLQLKQLHVDLARSLARISRVSSKSLDIINLKEPEKPQQKRRHVQETKPSDLEQYMLEIPEEQPFDIAAFTEHGSILEIPAGRSDEFILEEEDWTSRPAPVARDDDPYQEEEEEEEDKNFGLPIGSKEPLHFMLEEETILESAGQEEEEEYKSTTLPQSEDIDLAKVVRTEEITMADPLDIMTPDAPPRRRPISPLSEPYTELSPRRKRPTIEKRFEPNQLEFSDTSTTPSSTPAPEQRPVPSSSSDSLELLGPIPPQSSARRLIHRRRRRRRRIIADQETQLSLEKLRQHREDYSDTMNLNLKVPINVKSYELRNYFTVPSRKDKPWIQKRFHEKINQIVVQNVFDFPREAIQETIHTEAVEEEEEKDDDDDDESEEPHFPPPILIQEDTESKSEDEQLRLRSGSRLSHLLTSGRSSILQPLQESLESSSLSSSSSTALRLGIVPEVPILDTSNLNESRCLNILDTFTGEVYFTELFPPNETSRYIAAKVFSHCLHLLKDDTCPIEMTQDDCWSHLKLCRKE